MVLHDCGVDISLWRTNCDYHDQSLLFFIWIYNWVLIDPFLQCFWVSSFDILCVINYTVVNMSMNYLNFRWIRFVILFFVFSCCIHNLLVSIYVAVTGDYLMLLRCFISFLVWCHLLDVLVALFLQFSQIPNIFLPVLSFCLRWP